MEDRNDDVIIISISMDLSKVDVYPKACIEQNEKEQWPVRARS